jgi:protein O-GlcNAc transferase
MSVLAILGVTLASVPAWGQTAKPSAPTLDRDTTLARAQDALAAGRRAEAMRLLRSAADRFRSVRALWQLARLQSEDEDAVGALASLERALALAPNSEEVRGARAELLFAMGRTMEAMQTVAPLTRMCPTVARYHYLLGAARLRQGDAEGAIGSLRSAEQKEPRRASTLIALGRALVESKLYAEAKPYLLRSLELEPENAEAAAVLASAEEGQGNLAAAETLAQRALTRGEGNATAHLVVGLLRLRQEKYGEAKAALLKAVAADASSARAQAALGEVYEKLGDPVGARKHRELERQRRKEIEARVSERRAQAGQWEGGTLP